jgi:hypothetical protein
MARALAGAAFRDCRGFLILQGKIAIFEARIDGYSVGIFQNHIGL